MPFPDGMAKKNIKKLRSNRCKNHFLPIKNAFAV
jgi:hypothetical protein